MRLSEKQLVITTAVVAVIISLVLVGLVLFVFQKKLIEVKTQIKSKEEQLAAKETQLQQMQQLEQRLIELRQSKKQVEELLPRKEEVSYERVVETFRDMAQKAGVVCTNALAVKETAVSGPQGQSVTPSGFEKISYSFKIEGGFFELIKFISLIEDHPRFIRVSSFTFTPKDVNLNPIKYTMDIKITTYVYQGS